MGRLQPIAWQHRSSPVAKSAEFSPAARCDARPRHGHHTPGGGGGAAAGGAVAA
jgi:hypothetical protein